MIEISELDVVEVQKDQPSGIAEGAKGTVVDLRVDAATVEFLDRDGYTIGMFEIPLVDLQLVWRYGDRASLAREE